MLLLIDNYDSFTYNLVHYLGELGAEAKVVRNDALTAEQALEADAITCVVAHSQPRSVGGCRVLPMWALRVTDAQQCVAT